MCFTAGLGTKPNANLLLYDWYLPDQIATQISMLLKYLSYQL